MLLSRAILVSDMENVRSPMMETRGFYSNGLRVSSLTISVKEQVSDSPMDILRLWTDSKHASAAPVCCRPTRLQSISVDYVGCFGKFFCLWSEERGCRIRSPSVRSGASCRPALQRGCVKTLTKIFGQKIDRIERPTSDDRHLGNGFGTPEFSASPLNLEFSHRLQRNRSYRSRLRMALDDRDCVKTLMDLFSFCGPWGKQFVPSNVIEISRCTQGNLDETFRSRC